MLILKIHNDGTGTKAVGNYDVSVCVNHNEIWHGRVEGHLRALPWRKLVEQVLQAAKDEPKKARNDPA